MPPEKVYRPDQALVRDGSGRSDDDPEAHAAAQSMARMIDDLMGLSKVTRRPSLRRDVDVSTTAREVAEELRAAEPQRRVERVIAPGMTAAAGRKERAFFVRDDGAGIGLGMV